MLKKLFPISLLAFLSFSACNKAAPAKKVSAASTTMFVGTNLDGAEFGGGQFPGIEGTHYIFPNNQEVDYFTAKGANTFRIGFAWERLQPTLNGPLADVYGNKLKTIVSYATSKGAYVLLNPQNFARYQVGSNVYIVGSAQVPSSSFADFWTRVAAQYKDNPRVLFGLVNEPHDMPTEQWLTAANAAIAGIRGAGAKNLITVPGNFWTGVRSWMNGYAPYSPNSNVMLGVNDPGNNWMYEMHHYFDPDAGGGYDNGECTNNGSQDLLPVITWLRNNNKKVMMAEIGTPNTNTCKAMILDYLTTAKNNSDVVRGIVHWSSGPWWGTYKLTLEPKGLGTATITDDPKLSWYQPFWQSVSSPPIPAPIPTPTPTTPPTCPPCNCSCVDAGTPPPPDAGQDGGIIPFITTIAYRNKWDTGYCVDISVKNTTTKSVAFHEMSVNLQGGTLRDFWDVRAPNNKTGDAGPILFKPLTANQWIAANATQKFGFCENNTDPNKLATIIYTN